MQYQQEKKLREQAELALQSKEKELFAVNQVLETQTATIKKLETHAAELQDQLESAKEKLKMLAHHDLLTNLPNRIQFDEDLKKELSRAKRYGRKMALLHLDIDFFKKVNDAHGREVGDLLLREATNRLMKLLRLKIMLHV